MQPVLSIEQYPLPRGLVLALRGELDVAGVPALGGIVAELCDDGTAELGLDLTELSFVDSTGLTALLATADLCQDRKARFWVTPSARQVERLFDVAGVRDRLPLRHDYVADRSERLLLWPAAPADAVQASA
jgi:anti-anti-sigma factor